MASPTTQWVNSLLGSRGSFSAGDGKPQGWLSGAWFGNKKDEEAKNKGAGGNSTLQQQQKRRLPRFAVELDGLNCFETIVPQ